MIGTLTLSAGLKGTIITAETLFYNCPSRRQSLKYPQEEANRIIDLLVKYAIQYPFVFLLLIFIEIYICKSIYKLSSNSIFYF